MVNRLQIEGMRHGLKSEPLKINHTFLGYVLGIPMKSQDKKRNLEEQSEHTTKCKHSVMFLTSVVSWTWVLWDQNSHGGSILPMDTQFGRDLTVG